MSLIVIAVKLSQPFDDIVRTPENESDVTVTKIDWRKWKQTMAKKQKKKGLEKGEEIKVTDKDVIDMEKDKIDDYLDWYQRVWVDEDKPDKMPAPILEIFPLKELAPQDSKAAEEDPTDKLREVMSNLIVQEPITDEEASNSDVKIARPGELYRRYRSVEELPESAQAFYEIAGTFTSNNSEIGL